MIRTFGYVPIAIGLLFFAAGCTSPSPLARRDAQVAARRDRCSAVVPEARLPRRADLVYLEVVRPWQHGKGLEPEPTGVELTFGSALEQAQLRNDLACHQVDVASGRVAMRDDDPFVLADDWIEFEIDLASDRTIVRERASGGAQARALVERAREFAAH
jgi:hypothetical protein